MLLNNLEKQLTQQIIDSMCSLPDLQTYCDRVARAHSLLDPDVDPHEFDAENETAQSKLYWSVYNESMQRMIMLAVANFFSPEITA